MLIVIAACALAPACKLLRDQPIFVEERKPPNVPREATYVKGALGGWWQQCSVIDASPQQNHCRIYNWRGELLYDETFLPYDGKGIVPSEDLFIAQDRSKAGPDRIVLSHGRILIPQSRYREVKQFLDGVQAAQSREKR